MTAEIDEDGVEIADYDAAVGADDLLAMRAEIERLRAERDEHLSEFGVPVLSAANQGIGKKLREAEAEIERLREENRRLYKIVRYYCGPFDIPAEDWEYVRRLMEEKEGDADLIDKEAGE